MLAKTLFVAAQMLLVGMLCQAVAIGVPCDICDQLGNNSYPVLNEIQISPDGKYVQLEIVSCSSEPQTLSINMRGAFWSFDPRYFAVNHGINVLTDIDVPDDRKIEVRLPQTFLTLIIANVAVPTNNRSDMSYQRIPDLTGSFMWQGPTLGSPNVTKV